MTREEIVEEIENAVGLIRQDGKDWIDERDIPLLESVIKALEPEPCDDCISRQAVLEVIRKCHCEEWVKADIGAPIEALPPVKPEQKMGRWEWVQYDANPEIGKFHCSECRYIPAIFNLSAQRMRYCPHCGCRMVEPQESEG